ncbi:MAG: ferrous iron transport protein A [Verrucomicrobia bacterium]|nr:ferrous iron transport protein A [Verrucomicrobiota bacterium]
MSSVHLLSELSAGTQAEIRGFHPECKEVKRLREMGLLPGTKVKLIRWAPLGDPLEIRIRGYNLSLRKHEAEHVEVVVAAPS